jgi:hypothetical protein
VALSATISIDEHGSHPLAIIASAILLLLGAAGLYVTRTADLMPDVRTIGAARLFK